MPRLQGKTAPATPEPDPSFPPDEAYSDTAGKANANQDGELDSPAPAAVKKAAKKAAGAAKKAAAPVPPAEPAEPEDLIGSARNLDEITDFLSVGYYGKGGSAKTTNCAAMVNICEGPIIFINAESGLKKKALASHGFDTDRILVLPDTERGQVLSFDFMEELYWQAKDRLDKEPFSIGGFVLDSLTEIIQALLDEQVLKEIAKAARLGRDRDRFHKEMGDYGKVNDQVALLLRRFRDLPCHFAYAALERRDVDDDGMVAYNPAVSPGLFNAVTGIPDLIGHTYVEEVGDTEQYLATFRAVGKFSGKDRYRVVPSRLVNPTFSRIHAYVTGSLTTDDDPVQQAGVQARRQAKQKELAEDDA